MEWLRTIDLAEYAPNLRGSGVHGAVMVSFHASSLYLVEVISLVSNKHVSFVPSVLTGNKLSNLTGQRIFNKRS